MSADRDESTELIQNCGNLGRPKCQARQVKLVSSINLGNEMQFNFAGMEGVLITTKAHRLHCWHASSCKGHRLSYSSGYSANLFLSSKALLINQ